MKLELTQKLQQQQILAPQMILSMDILLLTAADLQQRLEREFMENPALELTEPSSREEGSGEEGRSADNPPAPPSAEGAGEPFGGIASFRDAAGHGFNDHVRSRQALRDATNTKHEALQNTEGKPPGLKDYLTQQLHLQVVRDEIRELGELIINSLNPRGYLVASPEEIFSGLGPHARSDFDEALRVVRGLDPAGVGAEDLRQCLLLQLDRDGQTYPLESAIIANHLEDLGQNKLPKIAKELNTTLDALKDAVDIILALDPLPGARYETSPTIYVRPDVFVEEVDGNLEVTVEDAQLPRLGINPSCRQLLKDARGNREVTSFMRRKIESAQWLIQAVEQRKRTLRDIAQAMVEYQREFMLRGPEHLRAMTMQTLADQVGVHISTVSRAIKGKYVQTPWGLYELRYFFTGGVGNAEGELESRRNVYRRINEIIEGEDKRHPYSDTDIARILQEKGLHIARRTVTKYRESQHIPSSRLRRSY
jgi:RNA polymerase sigma-54 factor